MFCRLDWKHTTGPRYCVRPASAPFVPEIPLSDTSQGASAPEITIYSTAICPYCVAAKNFLKSKGRTWTEVRIDLDPAEREKMMAKANRTSVPQIFVGEVHVGGYDDMIALHRAGKLDALLAGGAA
ncbi:MAG: glutaredoxin 3 [Xanthomonas sp.]|nr:glutaredoxin 3 [Xanthomonas sp.]